MDKQQLILDLFFNKHLKQKEIAVQVEKSQQYISKIIKLDKRYKDEKKLRKSINSEKRKITQAEYQKNYIRTKKSDIAYEQMLAIQAKDVAELSYNAHPFSDYAFRKANSSIYKYSKDKNQYVMLKGIKAGINAPKRISCNIY